ncbi:hypothetical protein J4459_00035 [Candidatus Woesearchaeota archaeon]|nr:hypothetical protein [Candidatus Woesearchaeota archaeon]
MGNPARALTVFMRTITPKPVMDLIDKVTGEPKPKTSRSARFVYNYFRGLSSTDFLKSITTEPLHARLFFVASDLSLPLQEKITGELRSISPDPFNVPVDPSPEAVAISRKHYFELCERQGVLPFSKFKLYDERGMMRELSDLDDVIAEHNGRPHILDLKLDFSDYWGFLINVLPRLVNDELGYKFRRGYLGFTEDPIRIDKRAEDCLYRAEPFYDLPENGNPNLGMELLDYPGLEGPRNAVLYAKNINKFYKNGYEEEFFNWFKAQCAISACPLPELKRVK